MSWKRDTVPDMGTLVDSPSLVRQLDCSRPTVNFVAKFKPGDFDFVNVKSSGGVRLFRLNGHRVEEEADEPLNLSTTTTSRPVKTTCSLVDAVVQKDKDLLRRLLAEARTEEARAEEDKKVKESTTPSKMEEGDSEKTEEGDREKKEEGDGEKKEEGDSEKKEEGDGEKKEEGSAPKGWAHQAEQIKEVFNFQSQLKMQMNSAMALAISAKAPEMLDILIENGADPESFSQSFPLTHSAIYTKSVEVVDILVKHGATFGGTSTAGTALHCAALTGSMEMLRRLVAHGLDINSKNSTGQTPLHVAIKHNHTECAQFLIKSNCAVDEAENEKGQTPLHFAAAKGNYAIACLLQERGADPKAKDHQGMTTWMLAALYNRGMLMTLLRGDEDVNQPVNEEGKTLLHLACQTGSELCMRLLLLNGADPNCRDKSEDTPLMMAVMFKKNHLVRILLKVAHCDVNCVNVEGKSALHIALGAYNSKHTMGILKKTMSALISAGADVNQRCGNDFTLLMKFIDSPFKVKLLLEFGADPNVVVTVGQHNAVWEATVASIRCLDPTILTTLFENSAADPRLTSVHVQPQNSNLIQYCLEESEPEMVEILLKYDCSVYNMALWLASDRAEELKQKSPELKRAIEMVEDRCRTPRSLRDSCRLSVLSSVGPGPVKPQVDQLDLPSLLANYMLWPHYRIWHDIKVDL